ncbi:MAG TPA: acylneuraminate cytidylyltransferase family protein [Candidatus Wunengus sp. YC60]|uniref:acylneuraminate cytidylyltransferase family protein n=1 Tax=Candidatus Wunengus sp. YC60 TaxID=3367697 RepID=UPI00402856BE
MIGDHNVTAIIPARGGSKGIKGKNLRKVGRYSLLERAILLAQRSPDCVENVIATTDDPKMYEISLRYNAAAPELRPAHLSHDLTRSIDVLKYVIKLCGLEKDYILMLQPTSPLRNTTDLRAVIELFKSNMNRCDAVASVAELTSTHPEKSQRIINDYLTPFVPGATSERPRQELLQAYRLNGAFYLTHAATILRENTLLPKRTLPYIMPLERSINLDHPWDMVLLEALLEKGRVEIEEY